MLFHEYLLLVCLHPVLIEGFDFSQLSFPWSLLLLINLQQVILSSYPNILISNILIISYLHIRKYSENLKYHLLILLHCLSEVNNLAVLLLQHILEVAHRGVGGGGRRCELLVDRRRRALERLPWVPWQEMKPSSLLLVNAVTSWKAVRLRSRPCWQVGKAPPEKGPAWVFFLLKNDENPPGAPWQGKLDACQVSELGSARSRMSRPGNCQTVPHILWFCQSQGPLQSAFFQLGQFYLGLSWREVLLEWSCEAEGGLDRGGPKGSGSPTTFMLEMLWPALIIFLSRASLFSLIYIS